jgi:tRNA nucleotidyltransferase (CCA-adding enzyme)
MRMFKVGGCVRDALLGLRSKDIDFAVEAESFEAMREGLVTEGFEIFLETPQFLTIRARFPVGSVFSTTTADFVLCRRDGFSSDNRRPDEVFAGTLMDDLARRDFTMNAIAEDLDGTLIDPFGGQKDIANGIIRFVGEPMERIREDSLRALRGMRFVITKGFSMDRAAWAAVQDPETAELLVSVSTERVRDELHKMFLANTPASFEMLSNVEPHLREAILRPGLKLLPSMGSKVTQGDSE